ncbi:unnamed protein product [Prunus armeniaca]
MDKQDQDHHICSTPEDPLPYPWGGIRQINSDQAMARRCIAQGLKKSKQLQFTLVMEVANEARNAPSRKASPNGKGVATSQ